MKYTVFADGGLQALVNQTKANKTVAADNTAALNGLSTDFENMSGQITNVFGDVENCLNELDTVKADAEKVNEELSKKSDVGHTHSNYASTVTTTGNGNAITAISQSGNTITATKGSTFALSGHSHTSASTTAAGFMSAADKSKLDGIAAGANAYAHPSSHPASMITGLSKVATSGKYSDLDGAPTALPNAGALTFTGAVTETYDGSSAKTVNIPVAPNAFSNVVVGSTTIAADSKTDTLTLVAGSNVTITPDATNDKVTISATDTVYTHPSSHPASMITGLATVSTSGKYSDLSGLPTIPTKTSQLTNDSGFKTTDNNTTYSLSKSGSTITLTGSDGSTTSVTDSNNTYSAAGSSLGLVKSGGDVTISSGVITVNDDSHNHTIANVDGLQSALDGKETSGAAATALTNANSYTDTKISALINSAPTTLDTLGEIATAMENNADVVEALEEAIGTKANASDLTAHTGNTSNPHKVTKSQVGLGSVVNTGDSATPVSGGTTKFTTGGAYTELNKKVDKTTTVNGHALSGNVTVTKSDVGLGNVENKSSATIRGELTKANVTDALGYTPPTTNTTYSAAGSSLGLVKSGGDVTISSGVITVNDDSHNHTIANVDGLQSTLDGKAAKSEGAFYIEGTGTTDSEAKTSTWTGTSDRITEYYDGLTIRYKIGVVGQSTVTLNINGLGAKTVYRFSTSKLTTHFPVGSIIHLIYHADLNDGCWVTNDYDANTNTYQRVYASTTNVEYPITARYYTTTGSSYYAEYGRYSTGVTLNPSTNTITATKFKGALTGNADTATKWAAARKITLSGDASGSVSLDGSADKTLTVTVADNSHAHTIANITNLQSTIDSLTARIAALEAAIGFVATEADM